MLLSIFPQRGSTPNWTLAERVNVNSVNELAERITQHTYSGATFKHNYCNNENFETTELIILDYDNYPEDEKLTLEQARDIFAPYDHIIAPTRSHQKPKDEKPAADRFRVILFLSEPITDEATYSATWHKVAAMFPGVDKKCKDPARRLFASSHIEHVGIGKRIAPEKAKMRERSERQPLPTGKRGKLSQRTTNFMLNGAPDGEWNHSLFKAAKDHYEQGYSEEDFTKRAENITGHLDHSDLTTIHSAFKKEPKYSPRDPVDMARVELWVSQWLLEKKVRQSYRTGILTVDGKRMNADHLISRMVLDAVAHAENNPTVDAKGNEKQRHPFSQANIEHAFGLWLLEQDEVNLGETKTRVAHSHAARGTGLAAWVCAVTGAIREEDIAVMRHFVWQVKRKMSGLKVDWHVMPILYGPTGSGKTEAVKAFLKPVEELCVFPQDMAVLGDSREANIFGRFYVAFFDELARADKVDVSALKNKITCETITHRKLGTNTQITQPNVCTFIGASNNHVQAIIQDPTSARRFWQLETRERMDWESINEIDYVDVWQSVSELEAAPILTVLGQVARVQDEELRAKSLVEQWLESTMEASPDGMQAKMAYESFMEWCGWQQLRIITTFTNFGLELKRLGVKKVRKSFGQAYLIKPVVAKLA